MFPFFSILSLLGMKSKSSFISSFSRCNHYRILFIIVWASCLQCQCLLSFFMKSSKSPTVLILQVSLKHDANFLFQEWLSNIPIWCYSSIFLLWSLPATMVLQPILYFLLIFSISMIQSSTFLSFVLVISQVWRTQFILFQLFTTGAFWVYLNTTLFVTNAHNGLSVMGARYFLNHITCITSNLASISGRLSSPLFLGSIVSVQFISGLLPSYIKDFIQLVILLAISFSISFAVARYTTLDQIM